jgi:hypothetical protein
MSETKAAARKVVFIVYVRNAPNDLELSHIRLGMYTAKRNERGHRLLAPVTWLGIMSLIDHPRAASALPEQLRKVRRSGERLQSPVELQLASREEPLQSLQVLAAKDRRERRPEDCQRPCAWSQPPPVTIQCK